MGFHRNIVHSPSIYTITKRLKTIRMRFENIFLQLYNKNHVRECVCDNSLCLSIRKYTFLTLTGKNGDLESILKNFGTLFTATAYLDSTQRCSLKIRVKTLNTRTSFIKISRIGRVITWSKKNNIFEKVAYFWIKNLLSRGQNWFSTLDPTPHQHFLKIHKFYFFVAKTKLSNYFYDQQIQQHQ